MKFWDKETLQNIEWVVLYKFVIQVNYYKKRNNQWILQAQEYLQHIDSEWESLPGAKWAGEEKAESGSLYCPLASTPSPRLFEHEPKIELLHYYSAS